MAKESGKIGKIFNIIGKVFTALVVIFAACMMVFTILSTTVFNKNDGTDIFGYRFMSVLSNSMSKSEKNANDKVHFSTEDIIIVKEMKDANKDGREYKAGDIIAFNTYKEGKFVTVTHKILEVKNNEGMIEYVTYGTNTGAVDDTTVTPENVIGSYKGKIPKGAMFLAYLKSPLGYIICILIPFLLLIGYNGLNCIILFRRYKREQLEEMNAEKAKIEAERNQAFEMMKELEALKAQMAAGNAAPAAENAVVAEEATEEIADAVATEEATEETADAVAVKEVEAAPETVENSENAENEAEKADETAKAIEEEQKKAQEMQKELEALKAQLALEEEKRKTLEMQRELEALKAQLAKNNNENN